MNTFPCWQPHPALPTWPSARAVQHQRLSAVTAKGLMPQASSSNSRSTEVLQSCQQGWHHRSACNPAMMASSKSAHTHTPNTVLHEATMLPRCYHNTTRLPTATVKLRLSAERHPGCFTLPPACRPHVPTPTYHCICKTVVFVCRTVVNTMWWPQCMTVSHMPNTLLEVPTADTHPPLHAPGSCSTLPLEAQQRICTGLLPQ
jgi:hypothetical protein